MRIGLYNEPHQGGIGGCEYSVAVLAEALRSSHEVDIIHHRRFLDGRMLEAFSETNLSGVSLRYAHANPFCFGTARNPWTRFREAEAWHSDLSKPYDLFVAFVHGFPPFARARKAALIVLFPFDELPVVAAARRTPGSVASYLKRRYHHWEWRQRFDSYDKKVAISNFTRVWTKRRWGIDCEVIYPPVDTMFAGAHKTNTIMSIGRFSTVGHSKKHLDMISAFAALKKTGLRDWSYSQVGSLGETAEDRQYF